MAGREVYQYDTDLEFRLSNSPSFSDVDHLLYSDDEDESVAGMEVVEGEPSSDPTEPISPSMEIVAPNDEVGLDDDSELELGLSQSPPFSPADQLLDSDDEDEFVAGMEAREGASSDTTEPISPSMEIVAPNDEVGPNDDSELEFRLSRSPNFSAVDEFLYGEDEFGAGMEAMEGASSDTTEPIPRSMEKVAPSDEIGPNDDSELEFRLSRSPNFSVVDELLYGEDEFVAGMEAMEGASSDTTEPIPPSMEKVAPSDEIGPNDDSELEFRLSNSPNFSVVDKLLYGEDEEQLVASLEATERASISGITGPILPFVDIVATNDELGPNLEAVLTLLDTSNAVAEEPVFDNPISGIRHTSDVPSQARIDYETHLQQQQQQQSTTAAVSSFYVPEPEPEVGAAAGQDQFQNPTDFEVQTPMLYILDLEKFLKDCDPFRSGVSGDDSSLQQNIPSTLEPGSSSTPGILGLPAGSTSEFNNSTSLQEQLQFWESDEPRGVVRPSPPKTGQPCEAVKKSRKRPTKTPAAEMPAPKKRATKKANKKTPEEKRRINAMIKDLEKEKEAFTFGLNFYQKEIDRVNRELEMRRASLRDL